jgi:uncharacterized protein YciI
MFVALLTYVRPIEEVDAQLEAHREWLKAGFDAGVFVAAGRRNPRTGGVILAHGVTREVLQKLVDADPFTTSGVATYEIVEFSVTAADPRLAFLAD